jgi:hypothetical protein
VKVLILPVFIRRDKLSDDPDAAIIYHHIDDGGNVLRREMVTTEVFRLAI